MNYPDARHYATAMLLYHISEMNSMRCIALYTQCSLM